MDNTGCYITRFCLLWQKATNERQNRLIYQPILSTTEKKTRRYTNHCHRPTKPVDIPTIFVHNRQNRLLYQPIFVHDRRKLGEITTIIAHNGQNRVIYQPGMFMAHKPWIYNNHYCSRQTKQGDIPTNIVHDRQNRLI